jgi:myo-inositol-1(or 4)-monophosphatase
MNEIELDHAFIEAKQIAFDAGRLMHRASAARDVRKKGDVDLVTEVDIAINQVLCARLTAVMSGVDMVAEEGVPSGLVHPEFRYAWIVDPIDGTSNFVHGLLHSAISIALYDRAQATQLFGIVYNPFRNELFTAIKGKGAFLNDAPLTISAVDALDDGLIGTGFAYDRKTNPDNNWQEFKAVMMACHDLRRIGAASLDLAYVAAGRFDGYFEQGLKFWDMAAGALLVTEAGGMITHYDGSPLNERSHLLLASNGLLLA